MVQLPGEFNGVIAGSPAPTFSPFPGFEPFTGNGTQKYWEKTETITSAPPDSKTATMISRVAGWHSEASEEFSGDQDTWDAAQGSAWVEVSVTDTFASYELGGWTRTVTLSDRVELEQYEAEKLAWQKDRATELDEFMQQVASAMRGQGVSGSIVVSAQRVVGSSVPSSLLDDFLADLDAAQDNEDAALSDLQAAAGAVSDALQELAGSFTSRMNAVKAYATAARAVETATVLRDHWKNRFDHLSSFITTVMEREPDDAERSTLDEYAAERDRWQRTLSERQAALYALPPLPAPVVVTMHSLNEAHAAWMDAKALRIAKQECQASVVAADEAGDEETAQWFSAESTIISPDEVFGRVWPVCDVPTGFLALDGDEFSLPGSGLPTIQGDGSLQSGVYPAFGRYYFHWNEGDTSPSPKGCPAAMVCSTGTSLAFSTFVDGAVVGKRLLGEVVAIHDSIGGWDALDWGNLESRRRWFRHKIESEVKTWDVPAHRLNCEHAWLADPAWNVQVLTPKFAGYNLNPDSCDCYLAAVVEFIKHPTPSSRQRYGIYRVLFIDGEQKASVSGDYGFYAMRRSMVPLRIPIEFSELLLPPTVLSKAWAMHGTYGEFWNQALVIGDNDAVGMGRWNVAKVSLSSPMRKSITIPRVVSLDIPNMGSGSLVLPASPSLYGQWSAPVQFGAAAGEGVERVMRYLFDSDMDDPRAEWRERVMPEDATQATLFHSACEFVDRFTNDVNGCYAEL